MKKIIKGFAAFTLSALLASCANDGGSSSNMAALMAMMSASSSTGGADSSGSGTAADGKENPSGFAGVDWSTTAGNTASKIVTVSTKADLVKYAKAGGYLIYVAGMIDMSEGMLPAEGSRTTDSTPALDAFVKKNNAGESYADYIAKNTNVGAGANTSTSAVSNAYKNSIMIKVASNTTILGMTASSGTRGGTFSVQSVKNVIIRNLIIKDACDPFPHHEANDGWNAQHDAIGIDSSSNIWVDHCTLADTLTEGTAANGEKWQTYDGLCDIKANSKNITVSYTKFMNHDKTMLIGSSDSDGSNSTRTITLHHNYFYNCGQRLPMVRNSRIHIYNNYYESPSSPYNQQYAIGVRKGALVICEDNYFGNGIGARYSDGSSSYGTVYESGNSGNSTNKATHSSFVSTKPFSVPYSYSLTSADEASSNAGAGVILFTPAPSEK